MIGNRVDKCSSDENADDSTEITHRQKLLKYYGKRKVINDLAVNKESQHFYHSLDKSKTYKKLIREN